MFVTNSGSVRLNEGVVKCGDPGAIALTSCTAKLGLFSLRQGPQDLLSLHCGDGSENEALSVFAWLSSYDVKRSQVWHRGQEFGDTSCPKGSSGCKEGLVEMVEV